jgi:hypothetical protein
LLTLFLSIGRSAPPLLFRGKSAQMTKPPEAEQLSGYKVGGFSLSHPVRTA